MEYILAGIWKGQMANGRLLRHMKGWYLILSYLSIMVLQLT